MSAYYPSYPGPSTVVVTAPRCSTAHVVVAWVLTVLTAGYLLPWAIAATRSHRDVGAIALVDLLLGWSLAGWIVALVWSLGDPGGRHPVVVVNHTPPPGYPQVTTYVQTYPQAYPQTYPQPYSQPSAPGYPQPYSQPSAPGYPQLPPAPSGSQPSADPTSTQVYPTQTFPAAQPSADQWQPAPWDRPAGPGSRG